MSRKWREVFMQLSGLLGGHEDVDCDEGWEKERTLIPVSVTRGWLYSVGSSIQGIVSVLELLGVDRFHGAIWNWTHALSVA